MASYLSTQPYKGTRDFYPQDMKVQNWMFGVMSKVAESFGFDPYNGPMLEPFELYAAKSGEELVNQQLYSLIDRGERKLAVRPEMTPTLARMVAAKMGELPKPIRWYSIPNVWRYERPQRGRLREHWQLNADILGGDPVLADTEILTFALELMRAFGGEKHVSIRINNRRLMDSFFGEFLGLSPEQALKVTKAIDAKDKIGPEAYEKWLGELGVQSNQKSAIEDLFKMSLEDAIKKIPGEGPKELGRLFGVLKGLGYEGQIGFDPSVMRGLDYYTGTVFEMFDQSPENRRAMFGGGRYDNLVGMFGSQKLSGVGLGLGDVTLRQFLETHQLLPSLSAGVDVFVVVPSEARLLDAQTLMSQLRSMGLRVSNSLSVEGIGAQLKIANKQNAKIALIVGDQEWERGAVLLKELATGTQKEVLVKELNSQFSNRN